MAVITKLSSSAVVRECCTVLSASTGPVRRLGQREKNLKYNILRPTPWLTIRAGIGAGERVPQLRPRGSILARHRHCRCCWGGAGVWTRADQRH